MVPENEPAGTLVGVLTSVDPNAGDNHSYEFASGAGDDDKLVTHVLCHIAKVQHGPA